MHELELELNRIWIDSDRKGCVEKGRIDLDRKNDKIIKN